MLARTSAEQINRTWLTLVRTSIGVERASARGDLGCVIVERGSSDGCIVRRGSAERDEQYRRRGVATWLLGQAAGWLRLAQAERLLSYAWLEGQDPTGQDYTAYRAFLTASGFLPLTETRRGWTRTAQRAG